METLSKMMSKINKRDRYSASEREIMRDMHISEFYPYGTGFVTDDMLLKRELMNRLIRETAGLDLESESELEYPEQSFMIDIDGIYVTNKEMGFSERVLNHFRKNDIQIQALSTFTKRDFMRMYHFGKNCIKNVQEVLTGWGFTHMHFRFLDAKSKKDTREKKYVNLEKIYESSKGGYQGMNHFLKQHKPSADCYIHPVDLQKYSKWGFPKKFIDANEKYQYGSTVLWGKDGSVNVITE
tara:strand:+ start:894 stop:1610 length:717 start_codon:yes stop_codon:yes gene_type:complete